MNYKEALYKNYRSTHNEILQGGRQSITKIVRQFPVNDYYYGGLLPKEKDIQILDIGCGDGNFVYYLQQRGYSNTSGIDLSEEQIALGQSLGIKGLELANLTEYLPNRKSQYNCIIAKDVIEHLTRQEAFETLELISDALKPNGVFIMQVPNGQGLFYTSIFYGDYTHEMPYTLKSARQVLLNAGFTKIQAYPVSPYPWSLKGKIRSILWKLKVLRTRFWKMVETGNPDGIFTSNIIVVAEK